ncbi:MAG: peptidase M23 [Acidimicrobiales bacterium]|nr:MAG: peptidase M23 [Acidimicrobiales bacterium]
MFSIIGRLDGRFRRHWVVAVGLVAVVCTIATAPVLANPSQDKQRVDQELAQAGAALESATDRAKEAGTSFADANRQLPGAQEHVSQAHGSVIAGQVKVEEARRVADAAQTHLAAAMADFDRAEDQVKGAREQLSGYARRSYESGYFAAPAMMLAAKGVDQVLAASEYAQAVAATQRREIQRMKVALDRSAQQRADVADRKRKAEAANTSAQKTLQAANAGESAARDAEQHVTDLTNQRAAALQVAEQERAASEQQYQDLQAESRRIEAALQEAARQAREQARQQGRGPGPSLLPGNGHGKGNFIMPVRGYKSSDFGYRYDPFYHRWQLHAGTDFAAPTGTPIWAAAAGRVIRAGWASGYGWYTCIYHGDIAGGSGVSTCYAHQSVIQVQLNQQVKQGQVIGLVGTTGASTGSHLHFEVRLDGRPVDPMSGWL